MKAYPDVRAAQPAKWFWLVNIIPVIQVWANVVYIGFWHQPHNNEFNPIMRKPCLSWSRRGWHIER